MLYFPTVCLSQLSDSDPDVCAGPFFLENPKLAGYSIYVFVPVPGDSA